MTNNEVGNLLMEGARIIFPNFTGREGKYNAEGERNFCVLLDQDLASQMEADGWNIKYLKPRDPDDPMQPMVQVSVKFRRLPPKILIVTGKGKTQLTEDMCEMLDWGIDLRNVDLLIRPYAWEVSGNHGLKAYLKTLVVVVELDALEMKYEDVPEIGATPMRELDAAPKHHTIDYDGEIVNQ